MTAIKSYGMHIDRDPRLLVEQYLELGNASAGATARFNYLTDMQKVRLAEIKLQKWEETQTETGRKISLELAETMALASDEYRVHIEYMKEAREESCRLKNQYACEDKVIELTRSLESSVRSQLNKLGA